MKEIHLIDNKRIMIENPNHAIISFKDFENIMDAHKVIFQFWEQRGVTQTETFVENENEEKTEEGEDMGLSPADNEWDKILEGKRAIHFSKEDHVVTQGNEQPQRLYQIDRGSCRIEKTMEDGQTVVFEVITTGAIFGEISFLGSSGGRATASVVANEPDTVVNVIEGFYLNILFEYFSGLSGKFYHNLGTVIAKRLKMREAALLKRDEDESELDAEEDKSEISETKKEEKSPTPENFEEKSKKNLVKRTQDLEKKSKKRRKSSNRIIVSKEEATPDESSKDKEKKQKDENKKEEKRRKESREPKESKE